MQTTQSSNATGNYPFSSTNWKDVDFPINIVTVGAGTPRISVFQGNLTGVQWAVNDSQQITAREFGHFWKQGSKAVWHCHIITGALDATDRFVGWEVEYTWANPSSTFPANVIVNSGDFRIPANTPALTHFIVDINTWTPTSGRIAAHTKARLKRIASVGTAPATDPFCEMLQLHIECDSEGSREITVK